MEVRSGSCAEHSTTKQRITKKCDEFGNDTVNNFRIRSIDARSYRKFFRSRITTTATTADSQGNRTCEGGTSASNNVAVAESCSSCVKKRKRVDFNFKSQCCACFAKPCGNSNSFSVPKVVNEQECLVRSPSKAETAVNDITNETLVNEDEGRKKSVSRHSMELTEELSDVAWEEESHLQTKDDGEHDGCGICMLGKELLFCNGKGCQRSYHLSCLDPPLNHAPFGVWHCIWCVRKKIELGVHSVSKGVDSIWDVRQVASDREEKQRNMEYLVKYQGLAHVHNRWISEMELLLEAPKLVAKFNGRSQHTRWKREWTVPQRLLQKRLLSFAKHPNDDFCRSSGCLYEWLVKWTGLGYEHATWELENASFLTSSRAVELIKDYEIRHDKAERLTSLYQVDEEGEPNLSFLYAYQPREANFSRLSELSSKTSPAAYNHYLNYVKKLCEHWHKGENAIIIDDQLDQERIVKVILFIRSLQHIVWRPFLIISSTNALSLWEDEFSHVAPSVNFIVYNGSKAVRSSIRSLEFDNEGGKIMFQVLLTSSHIAVEDIEVLKSIAWRAVIIDECQRFSKHFEQFKMIAADRRLFVSSQFKECYGDYINMLSLLDSGVNELNRDDPVLHSSTDITKLKERLAPYIAYQCKSNSFSFVEYWVPVWLSNVQLEQYCSLLLSNPTLLYSCLKNDHVDTLREIIISIQKCCDHPYLLDHSLQSVVRKDLPIEKYLDVDILVSGKLLVLDKMLLEIKSRGLRALIVFQSIGGFGRNNVGDILEDIVNQRFGNDCYVRIDGGVYARSNKQKQAALNMFNSTESGRFVFLIENRACLPSIKLSSVDTIILFDSDWDPQNDLRALHKITINSHCKRLKIFRLYSCFTIEEMVLKLAKEGSSVESVDTINRNACLLLLSWGVSHLFNKLDDFHQCKTLASDSNIYWAWSFLDNVFHELSDQLHASGGSDPGSYSFISEATHTAGEYSRHILLIGEKEISLTDTEPPSFFWKNLLGERHPLWHFLSKSSPRIRRKVKYVDNFMKESEIENFDLKKSKGTPVSKKARLKRKRKLLSSVWGSECPKVNELHPLHCPMDKSRDLYLVADSSAMHPLVHDTTRVPQVNMVVSEKQNICPGVRKKTLSSSLKLQITQLCDALKLPEDVKSTTVTLVEYIREVFNVSWGTAQTLQAFQISLCWTAAALLEYKIDHKESLVLAKLHLNFDCKEDEANYIYSELHNLKNELGRYVKNMKIAKESNCAKNSKSTSSEQRGLEKEELTMSSGIHIPAVVVSLEEGEIPMIKNPSKYSGSARLDQQDSEGGEMEGESQQLNVLDKNLEEGELPVCSNHRNNLLSTTFDQQDLEEGEIPVTPHSQTQLDQPVPQTVEQKSALERLDNTLEEKRDTSNSQIEMPQKEFDTPLLTSRVMEEQLKDNDQIVQLEKAKKEPVPSPGSPCLSDSGSKIDKVQTTDVSTTSISSQSAITETKLSLPNETLPTAPPQTSECSLNEKGQNSQVGTVTILIESDAEGDKVEAIVLESGVSNCSMHNNEVNGSTHGLQDGAPRSTSVERNPGDDVQIISDVPQSPLKEGFMVVENICCSTRAMCTENQSAGIERDNASEVLPDTASLAPVCTEPRLDFTGTSPVVQAHISHVDRNSFPFHQPPIPAISLLASAQEVQFSGQPMPEVGNPSVGNLPLPPSRGTQMGRYGLYIQEPTSRTNVQDFRSIANIVGSSHPPLRSNHVIPEGLKLACNDPLHIEMERIKKDDEKDFKMHEQTVLHIKSERDREIEELIKKYDVLLQDAEKALLQKRKEHWTNFQKVYVNKLLAEALTLKESDCTEAPASTITNQLIQQSNLNLTHMSAMRPEQYPPNRLAAASAGVINQPSLVLSNGSVRPYSSSVGGIMGELQNGCELQGPAPHLRASISQSLMSTLRLPVLGYGALNQHLPSSTITPPNIQN